jgi:hypothetical protein
VATLLGHPYLDQITGYFRTGKGCCGKNLLEIVDAKLLYSSTVNTPKDIAVRKYPPADKETVAPSQCRHA